MKALRSCLEAVVAAYYTSMLNHTQYARIVNRAVRLLFDVFDWLIVLLTWFTSTWSRKKPLPPIKSDLLHISASQLALRIRSREVRCIDLVETYINRIKDVQPIINSVVQDRFEEALNEAKAVDKFIEEHHHHHRNLAQDKPLLGVPLTVKETIAVKGMSNNGARSRVPSRIAEEDADVVKKLREAGAIPIVVTNTPELCLYWETYNPKVGRTLNPYDTRKTCGGSSGGEVSLIASGGSVIGMASDIAGSLRLPAFFCGVYGHKPTPGYVSNNGHIPTSTDPMWDHYFTLGPVTRYAEDIPLMLKAVAEPSKVGKLRLDDNVDVTKVRILYMYGEGCESTLQKVPGVESMRAIGMAISVLKEKYGCQVEQVKISEFTDSIYMNSLILQMKGIENVFQPDDDHPDDWGIMQVLNVIFKKLTFQSSASISCILYGPLKAIVDLTPDSIRSLLNQRANSVQTKVEELLKDDAVLLYPTFPEEAPLHHRMCSKILEVSYCTIFNILGMPVTQCPITQTGDGLPVGLQIAAAPHQDRLCLAVARALEKELGGWVPPNH